MGCQDGWIRRILVPCLLVLAVAAPRPAHAGPAPVAGFDPTPVPPALSPLAVPAPSGCGQGSWVAGTTEVCAGEVVHRDYVYDDFGSGVFPNPPPEFPLPGALLPTVLPTGGAYGFLPPSGAQQNDRPEAEKNTTDIVALRLRGAGADIAVTVELNALRDPASTRVVLAVDRDPGAGTGGGALPGLVANPLLAVAPSVPGWDGPLVELACDAGTNLCTGSLPAPAGGLRVTALAVRAADGVVMNVVPRGTGETGFWWESVQAGTLVGGDLSPFVLDIPATDLDPATTRRAETPTGVVLQRVYPSNHPLGEGVSDDGVPGPAVPGGAPPHESGFGQAFNLIGPYLPYGFVLPAGPGPHPTQLAMHGLAENHSARLYFSTADGGFVDRFVDQQQRVVVSPTGRGWKNWWSAHGERDAWDSLADAVANYPVARDEMFVSGYSMGGYGTLRLGALYPDEWAAAINWVGYTGDTFNGAPLVGLFGDSPGAGGSAGTFGNTLDLVGNLRHVPMAGVYGAADELVHLTQALALRGELARLQVPSAFWLSPTADHLGPMVADDWGKEAAWSAGRHRVVDPRTISFRTDRRLFLPDLGVVPDHAYWIRAIVPAADGYADVTAVSDGCGGDEPVYEVSEGLGPIDPPPLLASVVQEVLEVGRSAVAAADRLTLTTANVASLAVETGVGTAGACLSGGPVEFSVTTDGPLVVRFTDGRTLTMVEAGTHSGVLPSVEAARAGETSTAPPSADAGQGTAALPATGVPVPLLLAAALLGLAFLFRRVAT